MENNITAKLKALSFSGDELRAINKFIVSLNDNFISLEDMVTIMNYLSDKGIQVKKPSQIKIFAGGLDFIKSQVEAMEKIGHLEAYIQNPLYINSKEGSKRLEYLVKLNENIKNEKGKYLSIIFSKKAFDRKYGTYYLDNKDEAKEIISNLKEEKINEPIIEKEVITEKQLMPVSEEKTVIEDKIPEVNKYKIVDVISFKKEENLDSEEGLINEILEKPQTIGIDDAGIERFEVLLSNLKHILEVVYNTSEIDETKRDCLLKLITNGYTDNEKILYYTIIFKKNISDEEKLKIKEAIIEELQTTNIMSLDFEKMGRVA